MAGRESAGAVYVTIDADSSPLLAKYQQAEAQSRVAGQRIATSLGAGFKSGVSPILTSAGQVQEAVTKIADIAEPAARRTAAAVKQIASAAFDAEEKTQSFVGVIPGLGRAAEHFINLFPLVGKAIMAAFPVLGAIALAENLAHILPQIGKMIGAFDGVADAEKRATEQAKIFDGEIKTLKADIESLNNKKFADIFGGTAGKAREAAEMAAEIRTAQAQVALIKQSMGTTASGGPGKGGGGGGALRGTGTLDKDKNLIPFGPHDLDLAELALDRLYKKQADLSRQSSISQIADSKRIEAENTRDGKSAESEAKRLAVEEKRIKNDEFRQAREFMGLVREGRKITAKENKDLVRDETRDMMQGLQEYSRDYEREQDLERREIVATTTARNRAAQEQIRAAGIRTQSADDIASLKIQQTYALQITHTRAEELQYAKDLADQDEKRLTDALATAQSLKDYADQNLLIADQNSADLAVARARADLDEQRIRNAIRLNQLNPRAQFGREIAGIGQGIPGQLGNALANGATGGGNIGQQVVQAFKGIGRDILGATLTAAIRELIIKTGLQTVASGVLGSIFGTAASGQVAATTAQTAATIANTAALTASASTSTAGAAASVAGSAAGAAAGGAIAPIIGGVISGVISAAATLIGDAAIVKAIHGTTAAVNSLRGSPIAKGGGTAPKVEIDTSTGFLSSIGAGLFQAITGAGALPVRVVAISPLAPLAGLFGLFGFASGGRPAPGVPYIVGENGPELRIDDGPGTIIPSVPSGGMSRHSSLTTSSAISNSSSQSQSNVFHLHGIQNVEQFARRLPNVLKARAPVFSPATR